MSDPDYIALHDAACARGEGTYLDPETGYVVFTRLGLLERDRCCGAGCRHCPFDHASVPVDRRARRIQQSAWLSEARPDPGSAVTALLWSGARESHAALQALEQDGVVNIVLITAFDARSRIVEPQEIAIETVVEQAAQLDLPLIGAPLHPGRALADSLAAALALVPGCARVSLGGLALAQIRTVL